VKSEKYQAAQSLNHSFRLNSPMILCLLVVILHIMVSVSLFSQVQYTKFEHLTVADGLSSNRIQFIYRDSKDYLWLATEAGLDRFNSMDLKKYVHDSNISGSISNNNIRCIFEDSRKNLWFGTADGLNLYNREKDNFTVFRHIQGDSCSLSNNIVTTILEDKTGTLWFVAGGNCLNRFDENSRTFSHFRFIERERDLSSRPTTMAAKDSNGYLWIVSDKTGIFRFDPVTGKFNYFNDAKTDMGGQCNKSLLVDNDGMVWIITDGNGFFSYNPQQNKFKKYNTGNGINSPSFNIICDIIAEDNRYLLLGVDQGGLVRFDKKTEQLTALLTDENSEYGLNNKGIWSFHKDKEGILWIGTSGGGVNYSIPGHEKFKLFRHNNSNPNSLSYSFTGCFYEDHDGMIWVGTDGGGLNVYNPKTGNFKVFKNEPSNPYSISGNVIRCIAEDRDRNLWIGTWGAGLNKFDRKTGRFIRFEPDKNNPNSLSGNSIWHCRFDHNGLLWLGSYNHGIDIFDIKKGVVKRYLTNTYDSATIISNDIWYFYEDSKNRMWICSRNGLSRYDSISDSFRRFSFPDSKIGAIYEGNDGVFWVGSWSEGLFKCDAEGRIIKNYRIADGLPGMRIQAILPDDKQNLWMSTSNGITRFNPLNETFRNYTEVDGLQSNHFFPQCFLKTKKGEMYFGGFNGFNSFFPDSLKDNLFIPNVYITDFQIFNKPIDYSGSHPQFPVHISEAKEITLYWWQSVFSFSFAAINYNAPKNCRYAYKLEGFEKEWNYTDASRRYVTYTNLDPGSYTFRVKASNNDGVWNQSGVALKIIILPPWWKTLWFRILIISLIIVFVYGIFWLRTRVLLKSEKKLKHQVNLRTVELLEKNRELIEINKKKDKFLSIMGHDLKNPIGNVNSFIEVLLQDYDSFTRENIKVYLQSIGTQMSDTYNLLENILMWERKSMYGNRKPHIVDIKLYDSVTFNINHFLYNQKQIEIVNNCPIDVSVKADPDMLDFVLRNLIGNAIKFSFAKGKIEIGYEPEDARNWIVIKDYGTGMDQDRINMFNMGQPVESKFGTKGEKGTGLGLINCREFVNNMYGEMKIESKPGKGTAIRIWLPET